MADSKVVEIDLGGYRPAAVRLDVLQDQLAAQGLYVVTAAEMAVLRACNNRDTDLLRWLSGIIEAELARREEAPRV